MVCLVGIFPSDQNKYFCYSMLAFTAAWAVTAFFMALFQCSPIQAYWLPFQYPEAKCMDTTILFYTTGFMNVASDFLIFLWPVKDLAKIQISVKQRVTLITMFSLGIVICIAGVCRLWYTSVYVKSYDILCTYTLFSYKTVDVLSCDCVSKADSYRARRHSVCNCLDRNLGRYHLRLPACL